MEELIIQAQPGPQEQFLATPADICIYGGSAGGGKSFGLLMCPLRHINNKNFGGVIFRRTSPMILKEGALWDESEKLYMPIGGEPKKHTMEWNFPSGSKIQFAHMQHEKNMHDWQGTQIPFIAFDELTHFTRKQFMYMLSRNRSTCGVKPYMRCTCNPDSGSWVRELIDWWIDSETGYAIAERSGVVRWFVVRDDDFVWGDSRQELVDRFADEEEEISPVSFTFIRASLDDNVILKRKDPDYIAKLKALPLIERERLLGGNWNINDSTGILQRDWIRYYDLLPKVLWWAWSLDTAIKTGQENDYSVAGLWAVCPDGYYLEYVWRQKCVYPVLKDNIINLFAQHPAREVLIEDRASGQQLIQDFKRTTSMPIIAMLPNKNMGKDKVERLNFVSPLHESGKVFVKRGQPWTSVVIEEWLTFPTAPHDDTMDMMTQFLSRRLNLGDGFKQCAVAAPFSTQSGFLPAMDRANTNYSAMGAVPYSPHLSGNFHQ